MKRQIRLIFLALLLLVPLTASGQFVTYGDDPGRLRWRQLRTEHFRLVYPEDCDSLARTYASLLEQYQGTVGRSVGMAPGQYQWGRTPVILHTYYPYANGSVTWAPRRMDLYTVQDPYASDPTPWPQQLALHESRHVAQMQFGYRMPLGIGQYVAGEMWHGLLDGLFVDPPVFEGDAVVAETALSTSGRARTADFLNYYQAAFDRGDWRDWYQWRYGSFKRAAPDYYTCGYMAIAGMRVFYGQRNFSKDFFDHIIRAPLPYKTLERSISRGSGKHFRQTWREIELGFQAGWAREAVERAPFMPVEQLVETPDFETNYTCLTALDSAIFALKSGKVTPRRLVRLSVTEDGSLAETDCGPFSGSGGCLIADPVRGRLYWSETIDDPRWGMSGTARIRYREADGTRHDLTSESRCFNPAPSSDGAAVAAVEYPYAGGSSLNVFDAENGSLRARFPAPPGVQLTEAAWIGDTLHVLGIAEEGFGIWRVSDGNWECLQAPSIQKMQQLRSDGRRLRYVSDRNGVNEWYALDPATGQTLRLTCSRYGGSDYTLFGDDLFFTAHSANGRMIFRTALHDLDPDPTDALQVHAWKIPDALSAQEATLFPDEGGIPSAADTSGVFLADAVSKPYSKLLHLFHFHSWLPFYYGFDSVESLSFDLSYQTLSLGASGFFQNDLGTGSGFAGYSAHKDPYDAERWRHSFHGKFTYSGLYPIFEASLDFNDRPAIRAIRRQDLGEEERRSVGGLSDKPALSGSLRTYIPLQFNKDGILRGVIPQLRWTFSNDVCDLGTVYFDTSTPFGMFVGAEPRRNVPYHSLTASVRGYSMLATASSQVYPRLGVGAETGFQIRPGMTGLYSPSWYAYVYGYLPGLHPAQGLRLSTIVRTSLRPGAEIPGLSVVTYPRGFSGAEALDAYGHSAVQGRVTADYAIPLYFGDISALSPFVYIRNFLIVPHADFSWYGGGRASAGEPYPSGTLLSAGADFSVETANLLWLPFDGSIGVSVNVLGGSGFADTGASRVYVGAILSVDI